MERTGELAREWKAKLAIFAKAVDTFDASLGIDLAKFRDPVELDTVKRGQIQTFEYVIELTWKTVKRFLDIVHGIETKSPKQTIKEFYLQEVISMEDYEALLEMIDDRNRLSHIYSERAFAEIHQKLTAYLQVLQRVARVWE